MAAVAAAATAVSPLSFLFPLPPRPSSSSPSPPLPPPLRKNRRSTAVAYASPPTAGSKPRGPPAQEERDPITPTSDNNRFLPQPHPSYRYMAEVLKSGWSWDTRGGSPAGSRGDCSHDFVFQTVYRILHHLLVSHYVQLGAIYASLGNKAEHVSSDCFFFL